MSEWKRSIVRIWRGRPNQGGVYQGTAFFISQGYLLTAKHVVEPLDADDIYLQSDTGAWIEGGLRKIKAPVLHPTLDIAVLPLLKSVPDAQVIPLASTSDAELRQGQRVTLAGYSTPEGGLEVPELQISAYHGEYDLEVAHTPIEKGMSGGPALFNDKLVAITRAKDAAHTYFIPLVSFMDFVQDFAVASGTCEHLRPISVTELCELKEMFEGITIKDERINAFFEQTGRDIHQWLGVKGPNSFFKALDLFSKSKHRGPDDGPLFELLIFLKPVLESELNAEQANLVKVWQVKVAGRLGLDVTAIENKLLAKTQALARLNATHSPVLLLKIEPKGLVSEKHFILRAWLLHHGQFKPREVAERDYQRSELESLIPVLVGKTIRTLGADGKNLLVEFVLPIPLFGWDINRTKVKVGPLIKPFGTHYPIAIRSWERIYHNDYDTVRLNWSDKWAQRPNQPDNIDPIKIRALESMDVCCDSLYNELGAEHWVFIALFCVEKNSTKENLQDIFGTMLAAGLPFAFWSVNENTCAEALKAKVEALVCSQDSQSWPQQLLLKRIEESKQPDQQEQIWSDTLLLWDNPERLPPDIDYVLTAPAE